MAAWDILEIVPKLCYLSKHEDNSGEQFYSICYACLYL